MTEEELYELYGKFLQQTGRAPERKPKQQGLLPVKPRELTPEERDRLEAELRAWQRQNARKTFSF